MTIWKKILTVTQAYNETIHSIEQLSFFDLTKKVFNECMTNFTYDPTSGEAAKPFRRDSREYLSLGLKLLSAPDLNLEEQVKIVIGTILAAKYHNDHCYEDDVYYKRHPRHITQKLKDAIHQLIEPHIQKQPYPYFWNNAESGAYLEKRITLLATAVVNKKIILDESIFIESSLIPSKDQFNNKLKDMFDVFDIIFSDISSKGYKR